MPRYFLAPLAALLSLPAVAQSTQDGAPVVPTSSAVDAPICTDRPTKSNFACTVPQGAIQVESDLFNWARTDVGGSRADVFLYTNPTLKYGAGSSTDLEVNWVPYQRARARVGPFAGTQEGVGDVFLRVKQRFTTPSGPVQFALIPFVKAPTAPRGLGNRQWEGGVIAPVNISVKGGWTLTLVPEGDVVADFDGRGHHGQFTGVVNLGKQLTANTTLYTEIWTAQNFDPSGRFDQVSADFAVARLIGRELQLDFGGNVGLNRNTPDAQLYLGISARFR